MVNHEVIVLSKIINSLKSKQGERNKLRWYLNYHIVHSIRGPFNKLRMSTNKKSEEKYKKIDSRGKKSGDIFFMHPPMEKFLRSKKCYGDRFTHVSQMYTSKWKLERGDMDEFWKLYCDTIYSDSIGDVESKKVKMDGKRTKKGSDSSAPKLSSSGKEKKYYLSISEKPGDYQPIIGDIDLKVKVDDFEQARREYLGMDQREPDENDGKEEKRDDPLLKELGMDLTKEQIYSVSDLDQTIKIFQDSILEVAEGDGPNGKLENYQLICFVREKPHPYLEQNKFCSGLQLFFPFARMSKYDIDMQLIPRVRQKVKVLMEDGRLFQNFGLKSTDNIVDSVTNKFWMLYGSYKNPKKMTYNLTKITDKFNNTISLKEAMKMSGFTLLNQDEEEIKIDLSEKEKKLEYYLPRILTTDINENNNKKYLITCQKELEYITKKDVREMNESKKEYDSMTMKQTYKVCKDLMEMINPERANNYNTWFQIGGILYNVGDECIEFFDLFNEFSKKTTRDNYDESKCLYMWQNNFSHGKYTLGSLYYIAGQDSPKRYEEYKKNNAKKRVGDCIKGGDNDLAKMLHDMYEGQFVCVDIRKKIWYRYENHKWHLDPEGRTLSTKISSELPKKFKVLARQLYERKLEALDNDDDEDDDEEKAAREQKEEELKRKKIEKILANLKDNTKKKKIMGEAAEVFFKEDFADKLDSNTFLFGTGNGVLDLKQLKFREGSPDDNISLSCGYDYKEYTWDSTEVQEVMNFMKKLFPNDNIRNFALEYYASLLRGGNIHKTFLIKSGRGNNGKSVWMSLIEKCLGRYCIKFPTSMLTGQRTQSSQAAPELARSRGTRFAVFQEPSKGDKLNIGFLKELTGNDTMFNRGLFKDGGELFVQFCLSMICNHLPKLPADDPAAWERVQVLEFQSTFLDKLKYKVPETEEEQFKKKKFPMDKNFSNKLDSMRAPLLWILFQKFKEIEEHGRSPIPKEVTAATTTYRNNNDIFLKFDNHNVVKDMGDEDETDKKKIPSLSLAEIVMRFKEWAMGEGVPRHLVSNKEEIKEGITERWGVPEKNRWYGYRWRTEKDDEEKKGEEEEKEEKSEEKEDDEGEEEGKSEEKEDDEDENNDEGEEENDEEEREEDPDDEGEPLPQSSAGYEQGEEEEEYEVVNDEDE